MGFEIVHMWQSLGKFCSLSREYKNQELLIMCKLFLCLGQ